MKIALAQIGSGEDVAANLQKVTDYVRESAQKQADLVVFPEATMSAFGTDIFSAASEHSDHWQKSLANLAQEHGITIVVGEFEPAGERVRNVAGIYSSDGTRDSYAKMHLYDAFGYSESDTVEAGEELCTFKVGNVTVGIAICYDIRFPKLFAELSRAGAQVIVVPTSWAAGPTKKQQWQVLTRARALDSNCFVVGVDQANPVVGGPDVETEAPTGVGISVVADPFGQPLIELGEGEDLKVVRLDLDIIEKAQKAVPVLKNAKLGY